MKDWIFSRRHRGVPRTRLQIDTDRAVIYAVGDVHGCYDELLALEAKIVRDGEQFEKPKLIIMLGDYVDRGSNSKAVIEHLAGAPPQGFKRICLAGNHDVAMLAYLAGHLDRTIWLRNGGAETLFSYGLDASYIEQAYGPERADRFIRQQIPKRHIEFLRSLPIMAYSSQFVFVHAGLRPGVSLDMQVDFDLINIRDEFIHASSKPERWVVHGHTRVQFPQAKQRRLGLETGVYETGRLSAARIADRRWHLLFS